MHNIIQVNLVYKLNSLMTNLSISNDLVKRVKLALEGDEELQGFLISLYQVKKYEHGAIRG